MTFEDLKIVVPAGAKGNIKTLCPNCSHTRKKKNDPCLSVNVDEGLYLCHNGCGFQGSINQKPRFKKIEAKAQKPTDELFEFFDKRGIKPSTVNKFKVMYDKRKKAIAFPFYYFNDLINVKYRTYDKKFSQYPDADKICYNYNDIIGAEVLVIVEGEIDCMTVSQAGFNVISIPDGGVNSQDQHGKMKWLDNVIKDISNETTIILALDTDKVGIATRDYLAKRFGKESCRIARMPEDCKDMNEVLLKHGETSVQVGIDSAEPYPIDGVYTIKDVWNEFTNIYYNGFPNGLKLKIMPDMQLFPSTMTVIVGIPGMGKTTFIFNVLNEMTTNYGYRHLVFSPEHKLVNNFIKLTRIYTGKYFKHEPKNLKCLDEKEMENMKYVFGNKYNYLEPLTGKMDVEGIINLAKKRIRQSGINTLVIDPWNTLEHSWNQTKNETNYTSDAIDKLKHFSKLNDLHLIIGHHPVKMDMVKDEFKKPTLYSINGSSHWFNKMDYGLIVHREGEVTKVFKEKIKEDHFGKKGVMQYEFEKISLRMKPLTQDSEDVF